MLKHLRNYFLTGLFIILPLLVSLELLWWAFIKTDSILGNLIIKYFPDLTISGIGLVALLLIIILTGLAAQNYIGKKLIRLGEDIVKKIPILRSVYGTVKQLTEMLTRTDRSAFRQMVLVEYPRQGIFSPGFLVGESPQEVAAKTQSEVVSVFIATVPNPTTGFLIYVPKSQVTLLDMSIEDGFKLLISAGVIKPDNKANASELNS